MAWLAGVYLFSSTQSFIRTDYQFILTVLLFLRPPRRQPCKNVTDVHGEATPPSQDNTIIKDYTGYKIRFFLIHQKTIFSIHSFLFYLEKIKLVKHATTLNIDRPTYSISNNPLTLISSIQN